MQQFLFTRTVFLTVFYFDVNCYLIIFIVSYHLFPSSSKDQFLFQIKFFPQHIWRTLLFNHQAACKKILCQCAHVTM